MEKVRPVLAMCVIFALVGLLAIGVVAFHFGAVAGTRHIGARYSRNEITFFTNSHDRSKSQDIEYTSYGVRLPVGNADELGVVLYVDGEAVERKTRDPGDIASVIGLQMADPADDGRPPNLYSGWVKSTLGYWQYVSLGCESGEVTSIYISIDNGNGFPEAGGELHTIDISFAGQGIIELPIKKSIVDRWLGHPVQFWDNPEPW